jgi:hypothetical protein
MAGIEGAAAASFLLVSSAIWAREYVLMSNVECEVSGYLSRFIWIIPGTFSLT